MVLINIVIGNFLDDSTVNKIIVMPTDSGKREIDMNVEMIKANLSEDDRYLNHHKIMFTSRDIYCYTEKEHDEVMSELKSVYLLK